MRIGIDLGGTKIEGIVLSNTGEVVEKLRVNTPGDDYQKTVDAVCNTVSQLQLYSTTQMTVGIGSPGALSKDTNLMKNCNSICLNGMPLHSDIESVLGYEIRLENDANCFALSEAHYGAAKNAPSMFGVIIGTGTGGGVVVNRQLVTGPNAIAGEWGHNSLPSSARSLIVDNRVCYCGRENCIETVLSGRGLKQTHFDLTGNELDAIEVSRRAKNNDTDCQATIALYSQQLARCLASIINVLDPHTIVLGGGLSNINSLYDSVPKDLEGFVFTDAIKTKLAPPTFGDASGALGAACLWPDPQ